MSHIISHKTALIVLVATATAFFAPICSAALDPYSQDFDTMTEAAGPGQGWPPNDLSMDGWQIYGFAWDANPYTGPANQLYDYGPYPAANGDPGSIQGVATGEGDQGSKALAKYSDYNNTDQPNYYIQALTYREGGTITNSDLGLWRFTYDGKKDEIFGANSSAYAYIQVLDSTTFYQKAFLMNDSTNLPTDTYNTLDLELEIDETMVGDILTYGFSATSTQYEGSAVFYDNLNFSRVAMIAEIDVKPGSFPNAINVPSKGVIPVAILTTTDFDASSVDVSTIQFGPNGTQPTHYALEDVDGDTDWDLILHFKTQETGVACGNTEVTIEGETIDAVPILGTDSIKTVGCK